MDEKKNQNAQPAEPEFSKKTPASRLNRRKLSRLVILVIIIAGLAFGIPWYRHMISHESTDDAFIDGRITQISPRVSGHVMAVHINDNQWVKKGDLLVELDPADYEIRLTKANAALKSSLIFDRMRGLDVDLSMIASKSKLDDAAATVTAAQARVEVSKAQTSAAASQCVEMQAQVEIARMGLELAQAEAAAVQAEHSRNQADLKRYQQMEKTAMISRQQVDHMAAAEQMSAAGLDVAKKKIKTKESIILQYEAALTTARDHLTQAQAQVKASQAQLIQAGAGLLAAQAGPKQVDQSRSMTGMAKADLEKARAGVEQAELDLSYTRIFAQTNGFVSNKSVEPGTFVQVGQPLMALVSDDVWVTANFKETQMTEMQPGQTVLIKVDTYPEAKFKGRVDSIQHGTGSRFSLLPAQNATGNFVKVVQRVPVKIVFDLDSQKEGFTLVPGMSVTPEVTLSDKPAIDSSRISGESHKTFGKIRNEVAKAQ